MLDTNVYISALIFGGGPKKILELAEKDEFELFVSNPIQKELKRVLMRKFRWSTKAISVACDPLWSFAKLVTPKIKITAITDDPTDNRILECATAVSANILVSGDKHLLKLGRFQGAEIMTPRKFLDLIDRAL